MNETLNLAREFLEYVNGQFIRLKSAGRTKVGTRAGSLHSNGYRYIMLKGKRDLEQRMVYLWHNPEWDGSGEIDHINRIRDDNRIENLRLVTHQENHFNRTKTRGYYWNKKKQKWRAEIQVNGKKIYLGYFDYATDARLAYVTAKKKYHIIEERTHG